MENRGNTVHFWPESEKIHYDICIFTDNDIHIKKLKTKYPSSKFVLIDPKMNSKKQILNVMQSNLVIVSSLEQSEMAKNFNHNVVIHHWFRYIDSTNDIGRKKMKETDEIEIVYHGNKVHLEAIGKTLKPALERLNQIYKIEFTVIYNITKLGIWKKSVPKGLKVNHVEWDEKTYIKRIVDADIGVIPNFIPQTRLKIGLILNKAYLIYKFKSKMNINKNDYLLRFKHNSNPGRLYEFAITKTPVVAEATLSLSQEIIDGVSGYLVLSEQGWFTALQSLIENQELRLNFGQNLESIFSKKHNLQVALNKIEKNLKGLLVKS
jgi:glycosyltransferase involved in cell wall biosynthesis